MKTTEVPEVCDNACIAATRRSRGRPLSFDRDKVLDQAMLVFWRQGYETASIQDLTSAMGITAPSLYAAFGDKAGLYREAIMRYRTGVGSYAACLLEHPNDTRADVRALLEYGAKVMSDPDTPSGCMIVLSGLNCGPQSTEIRALLTECRQDFETDLAARIQHGIDAGDVPPEVSAKALAKFYSTVLAGMAVQAREGASHEVLLALCDAAMTAWPAR